MLGPASLQRLKDAAGPEGAAKLDRAPTLVAVTVLRDEDPAREEEDLCATACAVYAILLGAPLLGWPATGARRDTSRRGGSRRAGIGPDERFVALIHLGRPPGQGGTGARPSPRRRDLSGLTARVIWITTQWLTLPGTGEWFGYLTLGFPILHGED